MEKEKVKLLAIQMESIIGDKNLNIDTAKKLLESNLNKYQNVDFVFLPEVWTAGWHPPIFHSCAESIEDSEAVLMLKNIAKKFCVNIIGGSIITTMHNTDYYNTCPVISRKGDLITYYNKNHLFSYYGDNEGVYVKKGKAPVMVNIEGINIGITICYDIRFPEIYRAYRKAGADVLINCAAWANTKPIPWEMMTKSRAIENQTYMVAVNQYGEMRNNEFNLGHSRIIDYNGNVLSEILDGEGAIQSTLELEKMYDFRGKCRVLSDIKESYEVVCKNLLTL